MPLHKQVHIGPLTYTIVTDRAVINQATVDSQVTFYANIRFTETDILIDPNQAPPHLRITLLHEVLHACFHVTMLDKKWEETAVRLLTGPLLDALRRNPELVAFLVGDAESPTDAPADSANA